jgi:D-alanine-D-alanine ligase
MRIGLTYDLKEAVKIASSSGEHPEDAFEEYDSVETIKGIAAALEENGHSVINLGGGRDFLSSIQKEKIDLVFNIAEGRGIYRSREAQVPGVLEMLDIPYTGSDPQTLAVCLDKPLTKQLVAMAGIATPQWKVLNNLRELRETDWTNFPFPVFVKPVHEGSSIGVRSGSKIETPVELGCAVTTMMERYHQPVMVEEFIYGEEITTGVFGNSPPNILGIMRVIPRKPDKNFIYSLEVKRDWERLVDYEAPAKLETSTLEKIAESALKAYTVLGCRDISRVDFRVGRDRTPYFLEINPLPGLNPKSGDIVIMSRLMGRSYSTLISTIVNAALKRYAGESERNNRI